MNGSKALRGWNTNPKIRKLSFRVNKRLPQMQPSNHHENLHLFSRASFIVIILTATVIVILVP